MIRQACGDRIADRLATDPALPTLGLRLAEGAELGYRPETVLTAAAQARELHSSRHVAEVLLWRVDLLAGAPVDPSFIHRRQATFTDRSAAAGELVDALRQVARLCDQRVRHLAEHAARVQPAWAAALGPVPSNPSARQQWLVCAAVVTAYRDRYPVLSPDPGNPIGVEPPPRPVGRWAAWQRTRAVLGEATLAGQVHAAPDAQLHEYVTAAHQADQMQPANVAGKLRAAYLELGTIDQTIRELHLDLCLAAATGAAAFAGTNGADGQQQQPDAGWLRMLRDRLVQARNARTRSAATVRDLEDQYRQWVAWYTNTYPIRQLGVLSAGERARRAATTVTAAAARARRAAERLRLLATTHPAGTTKRPAPQRLTRPTQQTHAGPTYGPSYPSTTIGPAPQEPENLPELNLGPNEPDL